MQKFPGTSAIYISLAGMTRQTNRYNDSVASRTDSDSHIPRTLIACGLLYEYVSNGVLQYQQTKEVYPAKILQFVLIFTRRVYKQSDQRDKGCDALVGVPVVGINY